MDLSNLTSSASSTNTSLQDLISSPDFDASDPDQQIQMQQALAKYEEVYGLLSAVISDMKTTCMSIIQKM
ncbi:MAG: hypothetical protein KDJ99_32200 [Candidatus Competibacteraceae bacterium]|nr:hypothetical protein [Candidatus Competibacteraceae bacterium]